MSQNWSFALSNNIITVDNNNSVVFLRLLWKQYYCPTVIIYVKKIFLLIPSHFCPSFRVVLLLHWQIIQPLYYILFLKNSHLIIVQLLTIYLIEVLVLMFLWSYLLSEACSLEDYSEEAPGTILFEYLHVPNTCSMFWKCFSGNKILSLNFLSLRILV